MNNNSNNSSMKMRVPGAKQAIDKMKYEIANVLAVLTVQLVVKSLDV